jgi:hypothetical protein
MAPVYPLQRPDYSKIIYTPSRPTKTVYDFEVMNARIGMLEDELAAIKRDQGMFWAWLKQLPHAWGEH